MPTTEACDDGDDPRTRRYPCPWCSAPQMWPDGCSESIDAAVDAPDEESIARCCTAMIELRCMRGDHRRCQIGSCTVAARWHEPVREAGVAAAREAGRLWAVVSTIDNTVEVVETADHLNQAKIVLRDILIGTGYLGNPEGKGLVYVVRGSDGGFL